MKGVLDRVDPWFKLSNCGGLNHGSNRRDTPFMSPLSEPVTLREPSCFVDLKAENSRSK